MSDPTFEKATRHAGPLGPPGPALGSPDLQDDRKFRRSSLLRVGEGAQEGLSGRRTGPAPCACRPPGPRCRLRDWGRGSTGSPAPSVSCGPRPAGADAEEGARLPQVYAPCGRSRLDPAGPSIPRPSNATSHPPTSLRPRCDPPDPTAPLRPRRGPSPSAANPRPPATTARSPATAECGGRGGGSGTGGVTHPKMLDPGALHHHLPPRRPCKGPAPSPRDEVLTWLPPRGETKRGDKVATLRPERTALR